MSIMSEAELREKLEYEVWSFSQALRKHTLERHKNAAFDETCDTNMSLEKDLVDTLTNLYRENERGVLQSLLDTREEAVKDGFSTEHADLIIHHRIGAMLLDLHDPSMDYKVTKLFGASELSNTHKTGGDHE